MPDTTSSTDGAPSVEHRPSSSQSLPYPVSEIPTRWGRLFGLDAFAEVADLLDVSEAALKWYLYGNRRPRYRSFAVPKRRGGQRRLAEPMGGLKLLQQKLVAILSERYQPKPWVHGFVRGRSVVTNARPHVGARVMLNVDLVDFFPSIHFGRIRGMFTAFPYRLPRNVASILAQLCCFEGRLPQGAPTSPIVANMVCARLDSQLRELAARHRCRYTRYADDLTFSTRSRELPAAFARLGSDPSEAELGEELAAIIASNGFVVNEAKVRLRRRTGRLEVTGITVNQFPNVARAYVREIRAMLHAWDRYGIADAASTYVDRYMTKARGPHRPEDVDFAAVVRGKLAYLRMVRGGECEVYRKLANTYADLDPDPRHRPPRRVTRVSAALARVKEAMWVVIALAGEDPTDAAWQSQGTAFLTNRGLLTCEHVVGHALQTGTTLAVFRPEVPQAKYVVSVANADSDRDVARLEFATGEAPFGFRPVPSSEAIPGGRLLLAHGDGPGVGETMTVLGFANYSHEREPSIRRLHLVGERTHMGFARLVVDGGRIVTGMSGGPVVDDGGRVVGIAATGYAGDGDAAEGVRDPTVIPVAVIREWLEGPG